MLLPSAIFTIFFTFEIWSLKKANATSRENTVDLHIITLQHVSELFVELIRISDKITKQ